MDSIGIYRGKNISEMTREELLDFARFAGKEIQRLQKISDETLDFRLNKEVREGLSA
jgi:hypothetical protein